MTTKELGYFISKHGEWLPKKHGEWRRINAYDDIYLVLDTWNGHISIHKGTGHSGTDNMYNVIYVFDNQIGYVKEHMAGFWYGHIYFKNESKN